MLISKIELHPQLLKALKDDINNIIHMTLLSMNNESLEALAEKLDEEDGNPFTNYLIVSD